MAISVILIVDLKSFIMGCIADTICPPLKLKDKKTSQSRSMYGELRELHEQIYPKDQPNNYQPYEHQRPRNGSILVKPSKKSELSQLLQLEEKMYLANTKNARKADKNMADLTPKKVSKQREYSKKKSACQRTTVRKFSQEWHGNKTTRKYDKTKRRLIGSFKCWKCNYFWTSFHPNIKLRQACKLCKTFYHPFKSQIKVFKDQDLANRKETKKHLKQLCEACQLGNCTLYRSDYNYSYTQRHQDYCEDYD